MSKDNANPIVYAQGTQPGRQRAQDGIHDEWWRDSVLAGGPPSGAAHAGKGSKQAPLLDAGLRAGNGSDSGYGDDDDEYDDDQEAAEERQVSTDLSNGTDDVHMSNSATLPPPSGVAVNGVEVEGIDQQEVYDLIRSISDPEHPLTLEQLAVVNAEHITIDEGDKSAHRLPHVLLEFTPTIPHCSMATLIGLALRVRLLRALPTRYKVDIRVRPGTHQSENAVNKQLNDKERVAAALENQHLLGVVSDCLATAGRRGASEEEAMRRADELAIELGITTG